MIVNGQYTCIIWSYCLKFTFFVDFILLLLLIDLDRDYFILLLFGLTNFFLEFKNVFVNIIY